MKLRWETPRYLGSTGGYTTDPAYALGQTSAHPSAPENFIGGEEIRDVPEVAVPADIQKAFTQESHARHEVVHAEEIRRRELNASLDQVRREAKQQIGRGSDPVPHVKRLLDDLRGG